MSILPSVSSSLITERLSELTPDIPVLSEEDADISDALIPMTKELIRHAGTSGMREVVIGTITIEFSSFIIISMCNLVCNNGTNSAIIARHRYIYIIFCKQTKNIFINFEIDRCV